jgi:hypothetical protein
MYRYTHARRRQCQLPLSLFVLPFVDNERDGDHPPSFFSFSNQSSCNVAQSQADRFILIAWFVGKLIYFFFFWQTNILVLLNVEQWFLVHRWGPLLVLPKLGDGRAGSDQLLWLLTANTAQADFECVLILP